MTATKMNKKSQTRLYRRAQFSQRLVVLDDRTRVVVCFAEGDAHVVVLDQRLPHPRNAHRVPFREGVQQVE